MQIEVGLRSTLATSRFVFGLIVCVTRSCASLFISVSYLCEYLVDFILMSAMGWQCKIQQLPFSIWKGQYYEVDLLLLAGGGGGFGVN